MTNSSPNSSAIHAQSDFGVGRGIWVLISALVTAGSCLAWYGLQPQISSPPVLSSVSNAQSSKTASKETKGRKEVIQKTVHSTTRKSEWQSLITSGKKQFRDGNYSSSEADFRQAATIASEFTDPEQLVATLNNLGAVCQVEKKFPEAEQAYRQAIRALKKHDKPNIKQVDQVMKNYANLLQGLGRPMGAAALKNERLWILGNSVLL